MDSANLVIGVWLSIALVGIVLYMFPALMKQLFFVKEQFQARVEESKDSWKYERPTLDERFVDVPKAAALTPPFEVGGAGGNSLESQPAPVDYKDEDITPMQKQGMQMKKAPVPVGPLEGFQTTGPSGSPVAAPVTAPIAAPVTAPVAAPACVPQPTYNPTGDPIYTCDGVVIDNSKGLIAPALPTCLKSIATKDGINDDEAAILNYCLANQGKDMPDWATELLSASTLSDSDKKMFATWAKDNIKPSQAVIKPTSSSGSSGSSGSTSSSGNTSSGKSCKPKPKCTPKAAANPPAATTTESKTCKGPIDMGDYIRKDSIPCWACSL